MTTPNFAISDLLGNTGSPDERDLASMFAATKYSSEANPLRQGLLRFAATRPGEWLFAQVLSRFDRPVYRLTKGRHTAANLLSGLPVVLITTHGARTGLRRDVPVLGFPVEDGLAVIASNFGRSHHPGWYYNLRANSSAQVAVKGSTWLVQAVEATGVTRDRVWREGLRYFPGWEAYEHRAHGRAIGVFVLVPHSLRTHRRMHD